MSARLGTRRRRTLQPGDKITVAVSSLRHGFPRPRSARPVDVRRANVLLSASSHRVVRSARNHLWKCRRFYRRTFRFRSLMRFADFMVALPFLLFMILFKIAFGIGPGESGIFPMLVALVILEWPATGATGTRTDPADS